MAGSESAPIPGIDLEEARRIAEAAVEAGGRAALHHFKRGVAVERKIDRSPVTAADRGSEAAIISLILARYPDHNLLTEESGAHGSGSPFRWIVDPLDGTRGFIRGGSFWGPLVALEAHGRIVAGALQLPVLRETFSAAWGLGCRRYVLADLQPGVARPEPERCQVSSLDDLAEATLSVGEMQSLFGGSAKSGLESLIQSVASSRCYGDLAGCAMLLRGQAEAWIESGVQVWDLAPLKILVEEAGGTFTDFEGRATIESGNAIASNGHLHDALLKRLR